MRMKWIKWLIRGLVWLLALAVLLTNWTDRGATPLYLPQIVFVLLTSLGYVIFPGEALVAGFSALCWRKQACGEHDAQLRLGVFGPYYICGRCGRIWLIGSPGLKWSLVRLALCLLVWLALTLGLCQGGLQLLLNLDRAGLLKLYGEGLMCVTMLSIIVAAALVNVALWLIERFSPHAGPGRELPLQGFLAAEHGQELERKYDGF